MVIVVVVMRVRVRVKSARLHTLLIRKVLFNFRFGLFHVCPNINFTQVFQKYKEGKGGYVRPCAMGLRYHLSYLC